MSGVSKMTRIPLNKVIRMSERIIRPEFEFKVKDIMSGVQKDVRKWPGLLSVETLVDTQEPFRYVVITEWEDRSSLKRWQNSNLCMEAKKKLDAALEEPVKYKELMHHEDNVFLL